MLRLVEISATSRRTGYHRSVFGLSEAQELCPKAPAPTSNLAQAMAERAKLETEGDPGLLLKTQGSI